jgi:hypothetical protein
MNSATISEAAQRYAKAYEARIGAERYIASVEDDAWIRGQLASAKKEEESALSALEAISQRTEQQAGAAEPRNAIRNDNPLSGGLCLHGAKMSEHCTACAGQQEMAAPVAWISHRACMPPVVDFAATPGALRVTPLYEHPPAAEPKRMREAINEALMLLGPEAPECSGCAYEWDHAIKVLSAALAADQKGEAP